MGLFMVELRACSVRSTCCGNWSRRVVWCLYPQDNCRYQACSRGCFLDKVKCLHRSTGCTIAPDWSASVFILKRKGSWRRSYWLTWVPCPLSKVGGSSNLLQPSPRLSQWVMCVPGALWNLLFYGAWDFLESNIVVYFSRISVALGRRTVD